MCEYLQACIYTTCMPGAQGDQKWALYPLKLEFQVSMSLHTDAETQTEILCKSSTYC